MARANRNALNDTATRQARGPAQKLGASRSVVALCCHDGTQAASAGDTESLERIAVEAAIAAVAAGAEALAWTQSSLSEMAARVAAGSERPVPTGRNASGQRLPRTLS